MRTLLLPTALLLLATGPARAGDVVLVDPAGGDGVALLAAALAAAGPGDTLLLAAGDYYGPPETIYTIDEGLTLLPAPGAPTPALRRVHVTGVAAGRTTMLRGLQIGGTDTAGPSAPLDIDGTLGAVWVEDCTLRGADGAAISGFVATSGQAAAAVTTSAGATFRNCLIQGGDGGDFDPGLGVLHAGGGAWALFVDDFTPVTLFDCIVQGGHGGDGPKSPLAPWGGNGGDAVQVFFGDLSVSGSTLTGGDEGALNDSTPGSSGAAVRMFFSGADARVVGSTLQAGAVQGAGTATPAIVDPANKVKLLAEPARSLELPAQVREGEAGVLALDGAPGDLAMVFLAANAKSKPLLGQAGTLVLELPTLMGPIVVGVLPAPDGALDVPFVMPHLPVGAEALSVYVQGVFVDGDGSALGGASALTWIDDAF